MATVDGQAGPNGNARVRGAVGSPGHLRDLELAAEWWRTYSRIAVTISAAATLFALALAITTYIVR